MAILNEIEIDGTTYTLFDINKIHPIGSIYMSMNNTNPSVLFGGTWESIASGRVLMGADSSHSAGSTAEAGLPNITGTWRIIGDGDNAGVDAEGSGSGCIEHCQSKGSGSAVAGTGWSCSVGFNFNAAKSSSIYGNSTTVQPPALYCYMWKRTA